MSTQPLVETIGIVGTGRVARALALALGTHSGQVPLVWGRSAARLKDALAQGGRCTAAPDLATLVAACDFIVIAVADDAVPGVIGTMAGMALRPGAFVCHVSGGSGAAILAPLAAKGAATAAVHPAMTFTGMPADEVSRMAGCRFAVTGGNAQGAERARELVAALGGVAVDIAEAHRPLYHAALCHGANHLVTLVSGALDALAAAGIEAPDALLAPLARAALENALARGFGALSGPVLRGDAGTVGGHLQAMQADCPDLLDSYRAMAAVTLNRVEAQAGKPDAAMRAVLGSSGITPDSVLPTGPVRG